MKKLLFLPFLILASCTIDIASHATVDQLFQVIQKAFQKPNEENLGALKTFLAQNTFNIDIPHANAKYHKTTTPIAYALDLAVSHGTAAFEIVLEKSVPHAKVMGPLTLSEAAYAAERNARDEHRAHAQRIIALITRYHEKGRPHSAI